MSQLQEQPINSLKYKVDKNFATNFDELINIDVANRKSNIGFTDLNKLMIKIRPWTTQIWNTLTWWDGTSKQFFYTDFNRKRWHYRGYNNKLYYLDMTDSIWKTNWTFAGNDFNFNTVKLPLNANLSVPTTYITPSASSWAEKVKISASDPNFWIPWQWVWQTLMIMSDSIYTWAFWKILENNWTEYILLWSWITKPLEASSRYKIYDIMWEYLQVTDWISEDRYFQWITENVEFKWLVTNSLRFIWWITSSQFMKKQVSFNFSMWSFNKCTLYYTSWDINNPFLHYFNWTYTLPFSWDIVDIFTFKNRLIVWGTNFLVVINPDLTYNIKSSTFWIKQWSLVDLWDDMYFIATSGQVKSLSEVISWTTTTIVLNDIWQSVQNYTKNFLTKISAWFDWRKMYMYWQKDSSTTWIIVIFDILYKIWYTYTGLRPSSVLQDDWITYITSNNSDKVSKFDDTVITDLWVAIEQKITIREIDLWDIFAIKEFISSHIWLENYTQELFMNIYMAIPNKNTLRYTKVITLAEKVQASIQSPSLGSEEMWINILWGDWFISEISYPYMIKEMFPIEKANIWKLSLVWKDGSPFYLNEMDIAVRFSWVPWKFFSQNHTY